MTNFLISLDSTWKTVENVFKIVIFHYLCLLLGWLVVGDPLDFLTSKGFEKIRVASGKIAK